MTLKTYEIKAPAGHRVLVRSEFIFDVRQAIAGTGATLLGRVHGSPPVNLLVPRDNADLRRALGS